MATSEPLTNRSIGSRVKNVRELRDMTQERVAEAMGFKDRQTLSDIENGKRSLKAEELLRLAEILGRDLEFFLDPFVIAGEARFSWRVSAEVPAETLEAFEARTGKMIGLLRWLKEQESGPAEPLVANLRLTAKSSFEEAQARAEALVKQFNLGPVPAEKLGSWIEERLSIQVLYLDIPQTAVISGAYCHLKDLGVILINRGEGEGRRNYDVAHELFHALTWEYMEPQHQEADAPEERFRGLASEDRNKAKRIENLADNFAAALLMPLESLGVLIDPKRRDDTAHLAEAAARLHVTTKALGWRLFNLGWINEDTRRALATERPDRAPSPMPNRYSMGFAAMLHKAIDDGRLSARKAAKALDMNLTQLAMLFTDYGLDQPFEL